MIYPSVFPPDYENFAEKMVYQALTNLPEKRYDIFFHKTFYGSEKSESNDYEIDFLIVDKRDERFNAILIVEVKGGHLYYSENEGCWVQYKRRLEAGPDEQSRKNKYSLRKRFKQIVSKVPIHWIFWFLEGVVSSEDETPTNLNKWQIFDNNYLTRTSAHIVEVFDRIRERHDNLPGETLDNYSKRLKISLLRGLGIVHPLNILIKHIYKNKYAKIK